MGAMSAGIMFWRRAGVGVELLLAHFGGPLWAHRDEGAWAIPKGAVEPGETPAAAALREFAEELGTVPAGIPVPLGRIRQAGGKWVEAFALEGDLDPATVVSNRFDLEWPPRSGRIRSFPEIDRAAWLDLATARAKILPSQRRLIDLLEAHVAGSTTGSDDFRSTTR